MGNAPRNKLALRMMKQKKMQKTERKFYHKEARRLKYQKQIYPPETPLSFSENSKYRKMTPKSIFVASYRGPLKHDALQHLKSWKIAHCEHSAAKRTTNLLKCVAKTQGTICHRTATNIRSRIPISSARSICQPTCTKQDMLTDYVHSFSLDIARCDRLIDDRSRKRLPASRREQVVICSATHITRSHAQSKDGSKNDESRSVICILHHHRPLYAGTGEAIACALPPPPWQWVQCCWPVFMQTRRQWTADGLCWCMRAQVRPLLVPPPPLTMSAVLLTSVQADVQNSQARQTGEKYFTYKFW